MAVIAASIGLTINQTASTMDIGQGQAEDALHPGMAMGDIYRTWQYQPYPNMPGNRVRAICLLCQPNIIIIIIDLLVMREREKKKEELINMEILRLCDKHSTAKGEGDKNREYVDI